MLFEKCKMYDCRGLYEWKSEPGFLRDTCLAPLEESELSKKVRGRFLKNRLEEHTGNPTTSDAQEKKILY